MWRPFLLTCSRLLPPLQHSLQRLQALFEFLEFPHLALLLYGPQARVYELVGNRGPPRLEVAGEHPLGEVFEERLDRGDLPVGLAPGGPGGHPPSLLAVGRVVGPAEPLRTVSRHRAGFAVRLCCAAWGHQRAPSPRSPNIATLRPRTVVRPGPPRPGRRYRR